MTETKIFEKQDIKLVQNLISNLNELSQVNDVLNKYIFDTPTKIYCREFLKLKFLLSKKDNTAAQFAIDLFELYPLRPEILFCLIQKLRMEGKNHYAFMLAQHAIKIPRVDRKQNWMVDLRIDESLLFELSILAFYNSDYISGLEVCNELMINNKLMVSSDMYNNVLNNLKFYLFPMTTECKTTELIYPKKLFGWNLCNPSICVHDKYIACNLRMVNSGGLWYNLNSELGGQKVSIENPIETKNIRCFIDTTKNNVCDFKLFDPKSKLISNPNTIVKGLEDCRIFSFEGNICFFATSLEFSNDGHCQMIFGNMENTIILKSPDRNRNEKNWLPFVKEDKLFAIYQYQPFEIFEIDPKTGEYFCVVSKDYVKFNMDSFRGSAGPFLYNHFYYIIIHEVIGHPDRTYFHRILKMSLDFKLHSMSLPFVLNGANPIEYVCGLIIQNDIVYISWGDNDKKAMLTQLPYDIFDSGCTIII